MKTLQEFKDEVAKRNNFNDWKDLRFNAINFQGNDGIRSLDFYYDQVIELAASPLPYPLGEKELDEIAEKYADDIDRRLTSYHTGLKTGFKAGYSYRQTPEK